jgi:TolB-like protein
LLVFFVGILLFSCASTESLSGEGKPVDLLTLEEALNKASEDIVTQLPKGGSLAVVQFKSESDALSDYIIDELTYSLVGSSLRVADRTNLDAARKELNFQASGEVDAATEQSIGKFLGVVYETRGEFILTGNNYRFRVNTVVAETSVFVGTTICNVKNDSNLQKLIETLDRNRLKIKSAKY